MSRRTRNASPAFESDPPRETANDRFKRRFGPTFWSSVIGAVAVHFALFALFPTLSVADVTVTEEPTELLDLLPETRLPEQPEPIRRPAAPIVAEVDLELTIDRNVPLPGEQVRLPAPPVARAEEQARPEYFTPYTVAPRLLNEAATPGAIDQLTEVTAAVKLRVSWKSQAMADALAGLDATSAAELRFLKRQPTSDDRILRGLESIDQPLEVHQPRFGLAGASHAAKAAT